MHVRPFYIGKTGDGGREGMCGGGGGWGAGGDGDVRGTLGGGQQAALNDQAWNMSGSLSSCHPS